MQTAAGIIERMTDADAFSFAASAAGRFSLDVDPAYPSGLALKVEVYDASGRLLAARDDTDRRDRPNNDVTLAVDLAAAGTYYAVVTSHGDYGDIGQYSVTATPLPGGWASQWVGGSSRAGYAGHADGTFTLASGGTDVWSTADQMQFAHTSLVRDGSITARITSLGNTDPFAKAGLEIRETLDAGSRHVAMIATAGNGPQLLYRGSTGGVSSATPASPQPFAPPPPPARPRGNTFTGYRSSDGSRGRSSSGRRPCRWPRPSTSASSRRPATPTPSRPRRSTRSRPARQRQPRPGRAPNALAALEGVAVAVAARRRADRTARRGARRRSSAGRGHSPHAGTRSSGRRRTDFTHAGTPAGATAFDDTGLFGGMRYFYRVRGDRRRRRPLGPVGRRRPRQPPQRRPRTSRSRVGRRRA